MGSSGGSGGGGGGAAGGGGGGQMVQQAGRGIQPASGHSTFGDQGFSDPMAQLARRIAELRGQSGALTNPGGAGPGVREELAALSELYTQMQQRKDAELQAMKPQVPQHSSSAGMGGGGGGGGGRGGFGALGGGGFGGFGGFRRDEPRMETMLMDPYKEMRESSIKAAQEYLKNPRPILSMKG